MLKIPFSDGTKVSSAKVTIDEVDYPVTPARYNGATPLSSTILNTMQTNIENAIGQNADNIGGEEYDNTSTYAVGDIVKYNGQLYICNTDIVTPEEFDNTKWDETDVLSSAGGNEIAIGSVSDITGKTKIFIDESTQALKYKDSTTGQFTDIAGDEVFIGDEQDAPEDTKIIIDDEGQPMFSSEVVNSLSGNETAKAPSVSVVKNGFMPKGTVLWTNPNPTSDFASQNITLSSSDYDYLLFEFCYSSTSTSNRITSILKKGYTGYINYADGYDNKCGFRKIDYVNDTTITIGVSYFGGPPYNINTLIPQEIIGLKIF